MPELTLEEAAQAMYEAHDAVDAATKGTEEYLEARVLLSNAIFNWEEAYRRKMITGYPTTEA